MDRTISFIIFSLMLIIPIGCSFWPNNEVTSLSKAAPFIIKSEIHLSNLSGRIEALSIKLKYLPNDIETRILLSEALYEQSFYSGDLNEIQQSLDELSRAQEHAIGNSRYLKKIFLLRATQEMSLHRFKAAENNIQHAKNLGATDKEIAGLIADIDWNQGRYPQAIKYFRNQAKTSPDMETIMRVAILEHQLGHYEKANTLYRKSLSLFKGANPVHYAWLKVQYGIHKLETSDFESARNLFQAALKITPCYILALEHLAETLTKLKRPRDAIDLYEKVLTISSNPEFKGKLALLYEQVGQERKAARLKKKAQEQYQVLLIEFPKAMYTHAADFFMEHKQMRVALDLLEKNLKIRPTSESFLALAEVQAALNLTQQAQKTIRHTLTMPLVSPKLCKLVRDLLKSNPKVSKKCQ